MKLLLTTSLFFLLVQGYSQSTEEIERKIKELGITLPEMSEPVANFSKYVQAGNLIFLAGHGPCGGEFMRGKVGKDLTTKQGYDAARLTGICLLATLKHAIGGDWSKVKRIVKLTGMVSCADDFESHSEVVNGCSDLLTSVFGEKGKHARASVGMSSLPGNIPIEVEIVVEVY